MVWCGTLSPPKECRAVCSMAEAFISHIQEIPNLPTGLTGLCLICQSYTQVLEWHHNGLWWGGPTSPILPAGNPSTPFPAASFTPAEHRKWADNLRLVVFWEKNCLVMCRFFLPRNILAFPALAVASVLSKNSFHTSSSYSWQIKSQYLILFSSRPAAPGRCRHR